VCSLVRSCFCLLYFERFFCFLCCSIFPTVVDSSALPLEKLFVYDSVYLYRVLCHCGVYVLVFLVMGVDLVLSGFVRGLVVREDYFCDGFSWF
jgi:hypothetical protein